MDNNLGKYYWLFLRKAGVSLISKINTALQQYGVTEALAIYLSYALLSIIILMLCVMANIIIKNIVLRLIGRVLQHNKRRWDNIMLECKVFARMANLVPGIIVYLFSPAFERPIS